MPHGCQHVFRIVRAGGILIHGSRTDLRAIFARSAYHKYAKFNVTARIAPSRRAPKKKSGIA